MIKRRILTVLAALFSVFIVFGCWFLTNGLLDQQHLSLMNTVHYTSVTEPPEAEPGAEAPKVTLSTQEIANILKDWGSGRSQHFHDPTDGQLSMEEAIKAAKSGLSYFCEKGALPKEILNSDFTETSAFLYDMEALQAARAEMIPAPDPAYGFWSVNLSNREVSVKLTLNAETGQIWMAGISSSSQDVNFNGIKALNMLNQYEAYLGLSGGSELKSDEEYAIKTYGKNQFELYVYKKPGEAGQYNYLSIQLMSTVQSSSR